MKATALEPEIILRNGKPAAVILDIESYREILERLEDAEDLHWLQKARRTPRHYRKLEDYLEERAARVGCPD